MSGLRLGLDPMEKHVEELLAENAQLRDRLRALGDEPPDRFCDAVGSRPDARMGPRCIDGAGHETPHRFGVTLRW